MLKSKYKYKLAGLGEICMQARIDAGASRERVAYEVGCSVYNVAEFERGNLNSAILAMYYQSEFGADLSDVWRGDE